MLKCFVRLFNFIRASLTNVGDSEGKSRIQEIQKIQEIQRSCKKLTYSVKTLAKSVQIKLCIDAIEDSHPSYINITILQCPLGFQPGKSNKKCICSEYLLTKVPDISCNIVDNNGHISVPGKTWIGNYSDKLAIHRHCPLDYCNPKPHSIDLRIQQQHLQCTNNRSGVLCGACQTGLSLGLGTARCLDHCSNSYYLFLIIPLALVGLAIVIFLLKCNITVGLGTINALILYVNIIHINVRIFFPPL